MTELIKANNPESARLIRRHRLTSRPKRDNRHWTQQTYKEYLQTQLWQTTRKRALRNADFSCQICKSIEGLEVHHNTYERLGRELNSDMLVVCNGRALSLRGLSARDPATADAAECVLAGGRGAAGVPAAAVWG